MTDRLRLLLVEDSRADARLILEVFKEEKVDVDVDIVRDGEAAMSFLRRLDEYANVLPPDLIILDLNMPKKDGREVLAEVKADPELKSIPILILTTSQSEEDIAKSYHLQASCYITKPIDLNKFTQIIRSLDGFWFSAVRYPANQ